MKSPKALVCSCSTEWHSYGDGEVLAVQGEPIEQGIYQHAWGTFSKANTGEELKQQSYIICFMKQITFISIIAPLLLPQFVLPLTPHIIYSISSRVDSQPSSLYNKLPSVPPSSRSPLCDIHDSPQCVSLISQQSHGFLLLCPRDPVLLQSRSA